MHLLYIRVVRDITNPILDTSQGTASFHVLSRMDICPAVSLPRELDLSPMTGSSVHASKRAWVRISQFVF